MEGLALTDPYSRSRERLYAVVAYEDPYVQPLILESLSKLYPRLTLLSTKPPLTAESDEPNLAPILPYGDINLLNITAYESIDFAFADTHRDSCLVNSYVVRKALVRKHFLSATVDAWTAKRPESVLKGHVKRSEAFEVDFAEFLDDSLVEAFDLRESLDKNEGRDPRGGAGDAGPKEPHQRDWWILKPSMSDRGQGIRLFSSMEELQNIFDEWEADVPSSDDGADDSGEDDDYVVASHLRHFVAQPYIHPPFLVSNRKFHIRTYVLCLGRLKVYVYRRMLALFAARDYAPPWESEDLDTHLTNTCLQSSPDDATVRLFDDLPLDEGMKWDVQRQISEVTGELFEAAARSMPVHFQPVGNAFEVFGLDFLVDGAGKAWMLEVNAFPDFKQTGGELKGLVGGFWDECLRASVGSFFGVEAVGEGSGDLALVRDIELGGR